MRLDIKADLAGSVWQHRAHVGDEVAKGAVLSVMESMKMEIPMHAPAAGRLTHCAVAAGQFVQEGQVIWVLEEA